MLIEITERPLTEHAGRAIADQTGGHWQESKFWSNHHVIDYPCTAATTQERLSETNQLILRLLQIPNVVSAAPEIIQTPRESTTSPGPQPITNPRPKLAPTPKPDSTSLSPDIPAQLNDDTGILRFVPDRTLLAPGQSLILKTALIPTIQDSQGTIKAIPLGSEPAIVIEPVRPEAGAHSTNPTISFTRDLRHELTSDQDRALLFNSPESQNYAQLTPQGTLTIAPNAPFTSFNITLQHQGRTASHRIDVRGPQPMSGCEANTVTLEIQWEEGTPTPDRLGWHTLARYPEFDTTVVEVPCTNNPIQDATNTKGVASAKVYRPTGNEDQVRINTYLPEPGAGTILTEQGQSSAIEIQWAKFNDGSVRRLTYEQRMEIALENQPRHLAQLSQDGDTWRITALQPGKTILTITGASDNPARVAMITSHSAQPTQISMNKPNPVELRMTPGGEQITVYPGDTIKIKLSVLNDDGSTRILHPPEDLVAFTVGSDQDTPVSPQGIIQIGDIRISRYGSPDERTLTATYQNLTAQKIITVKEPPPPNPAVNQDCTYRRTYNGQRLRANSVLISTWNDNTTFRMTTKMKELGFTQAGTRPNEDRPIQKDHILTFPCTSPEDLREAWQTAYEAKPTKSIEPYPITGINAAAQRLILNTTRQTSLGIKEKINISFAYQDGSRRDATQKQLVETRVQSTNRDIVQLTGPDEYTSIRTGVTTLKARHLAQTDEVQIQVENIPLDSQCRIWYLYVDIGESRGIRYARLNTIHLELHKEHGRSAAQEIADQGGAKLTPGFLGLEASPTYVLEIDRECNPLGQTIQEKFNGDLLTASQIREDPRVRQAKNPGGQLGTNLNLRYAELTERHDINEHAPNPTIPPKQIAGLAAHIHDARNISPMNEIRIAPYLIDTDGQIRRISEQLRKRIRVTSGDPNILRVTNTPDRSYAADWQLSHQTIWAHKPGQAELTLELQGHTTKLNITVQPPLETFPDIPKGCTQKLNGIEFNPSRIVLTLQDITKGGYATTPDYAHAIAGDIEASVIASSPDGKTHLLEAHCTGPDQPRPYSLTKSADFYEVQSVHPQIISIDGTQPEHSPRDLRLNAQEKILECEARVRSQLAYTWPPLTNTQQVVQQLQDTRACEHHQDKPTPHNLLPERQTGCANRKILDPATLPSGLRNSDGAVTRNTGSDEEGNLIIHWDPENPPQTGPNCWIHLAGEERWRLK